MKKYYLLGCLSIILSLPLHAQISFANKVNEIGVKHFKTASTVGNGVSCADFDGDGLDDLTIGTQNGSFIEFYKNKGGYFERILPLVTHRDEAKQIIWVDFDNDGDQDLFVASYNGANRLYRNTGNLNLVDVTEEIGLPTYPEYTFGATWGDYDRDGWLDLYFGTHEDVTPNKYNKLFRNNKGQSFKDVSEQTGTDDLNKLPFCSAFLDINNDKWPDIYTANDKLTFNTMLMNNGGTFKDIGRTSKSDLRMNAMCVAVGDYNNDGWQDIYVTNTPSGNRLLTNKANPNFLGIVEFEESAELSGVGYYGNGWGANFLDADNDGDLDLYVSGSSKIEAMQNRSSVFYENLGDGQFIAPECGMKSDSAISYVNAIGDFNSDGYPDIAVQNNPPYRHHLWENQGQDNHWIKIKLQGVLSNRDAIGAKIEVYSGTQYQMRYIHCGIGFMGQNSKTEIIGTAQSEKLDSIIITWPTGHQDHLFDIPVNQILQVTEGMTSGGEISVDPGWQGVVTSTQNDLTFEDPKIVPNPVESQFQVQLRDAKKGSFEVLDISGKVLQFGKYAQEKFELNVSTLPAGVYIFKAKDSDGKIFRGRFVKR